MSRSEKPFGDFGLSLGETEPSGKLCPTDGRCRLLRLTAARAARPGRGQFCDTALVFDHTGCRPNWLPGAGNERERDRVLVRKHLVDCTVQQRDGQAVQVRRDSDDDVGAGEGLL